MAQQSAVVGFGGQRVALGPPLTQPTRRRVLDDAVEGAFVCLSIWFGANIDDRS